jgi:NADH-quinone oxidoreductase subunit B
MSAPIDLGLPGLVAPSAPVVERLSIAHDRTYVVTLVNAGLACCSVEFAQAVEQWAAASPADGSPPDGPTAFVVSGTCTAKIAPLVTRLYSQMPAGTKVVSFGACTASGGPYWDSYSVIKGIGDLIRVDLYIPGCPPRPQALLDGLSQLFSDRGGEW